MLFSYISKSLYCVTRVHQQI